MMDGSRAIALLAESLRHSTDKRYIGFRYVAPYAKADWALERPDLVKFLDARRTSLEEYIRESGIT
jgi:hypothetical protein